MGRGAGIDGSDAEVPFPGYFLESRLAAGGMSELFVARPRGPGGPATRVVIKRLRPNLVEDESAREAFGVEATRHAAVRHENVIGFYETRSLNALTTALLG